MRDPPFLQTQGILSSASFNFLEVDFSQNSHSKHYGLFVWCYRRICLHQVLLMIEQRLEPHSGLEKTIGSLTAQKPSVGRRKALGVFLIFLGALAVYLLARGPLGELPARTLAIFFFAALCWGSEVIPLYATSFVVVGAEILLLAMDGGLARQFTALAHAVGLPPVAWSAAGELPPAKPSTFLSPLSSDIMFLFMGGFLLSVAVTRHGLDRVLARLFLRPFRHSPLSLMTAVTFSAAGLSMWMSNTATAAMLVAVIRPIVQTLSEKERFRSGLVLAICVGSNIGGIGTPIGTPPNAIAYGALNAAGYEISFLGWMLMALPLALLLLTISIAILWFFHRPEPEFVMPEGAWGEESSSVPMPKIAWVTLGILLFAVMGWLTGDLTGISPGVVALMAAGLLTSTQAVTQRDVDSIDWNVLILIWGGLTLSVALDVSGLSQLMAAMDLSLLPGGPWLIGVVIAAVALAMSTFMSNTATAGLLVPMALALSIVDRQELVVLAALACSFAMALPVSTPPNAIAYATGTIKLSSMIRLGGILGIVSTLIMLAGYKIVLPLVLEGTPK
jgi:sodium-dependent dicarboxylate transporter 2/3/5